jgi:mycobactin lysine-N-oxygenase
MSVEKLAEGKRLGGEALPKRRRILVIGGGPKSLAIGIKAAALRQLLKADCPSVRILEKASIGANWKGGKGYTDGQQFLCTPPEKDLGFPYQSVFGLSVDRSMLEYSWQRFLVEIGQFAEWVDRGRLPPRHDMFAKYLEWASLKAKLEVLIGSAVQIGASGETWKVRAKTSAGIETLNADALVITGPGDISRLPGQPLRHPRIFSGKSLWQHLQRFDGISNQTIAVVGSGETAAACVMALLRRVDETTQVLVINRQPTIYSRGESFHENRLFTSPEGWEKLSERDRLDFFDRTDKGVFSTQSKRFIDRYRNVQHESLDVSEVMMRKKHLETLPILAGQYSGKKRRIEVDYLVVATSFNRLWFARMLPLRFRRLLPDVQTAARLIQWDLSVSGVSPPLHLPNLAGLSQGPGFPNLTSLGELSDRVLMPPFFREI